MGVILSGRAWVGMMLEEILKLLGCGHGGRATDPRDHHRRCGRALQHSVAHSVLHVQPRDPDPPMKLSPAPVGFRASMR